MSMTEEAVEAPKQKIKRKKRAKPQRRAKVQPAARGGDEIDGITEKDCCFDCTQERCAITRINVCGHPNKGGLQAPLMGKPDVVVRFNRARKLLSHLKVDKKDDAIAL